MPFYHTFREISKKSLSLLFIILAGSVLLQRSDIKVGNRVEEVRSFTRAIEFDFVSWTLNALGIKIQQMSLGAVDYLEQEDRSSIVLDYLALNDEIGQLETQVFEIYANPDIADPEITSQPLHNELQDLLAKREKLAPLAESIVQDQLSEILAELEMTTLGQPVPPVLYHISPVPRGLVVSPRDAIQQDANIAIDPEITIAEMVALENKVDAALDVSSLVVGLGGIGLYPTMVMETSNINWLAEVVSHEWVHNFLTLRPLGANYNTSPELRIINETVANLAEKEIGTAVIQRFYPDFAPKPTPPSTNKTGSDDLPVGPPPFDFRAEMHETRLTTDLLLSEEKIEEAEAYLESRRQMFWEQGYRIRKLNQAYFAFYGAYADQPGGPAGSTEDPIGDAVRKLRTQSPSLASFLNRISWMWSLEQLFNAVETIE